MKKSLLSSLLLYSLWGLLSPVFGQNKAIPYVSHFNNFQKFTSEYKKDSALFSANELAKQNESNLNALLHDSFAQNFLNPVRSAKDSIFNYELLALLAKSSNLTVSNSVKPLVMWVRAKQKTTIATELNQIIGELTELHARLPRQQTNRTERYALLIHKIAQQYPSASASAENLMNAVLLRLDNLVKNDFYYFQGLDRAKTTQRAYFRFLFAGANYFKAQQFEATGKAEAAQFFQKASEWSPDESDRNEKHGFFYENVFLFDSDEDEPVFNARYLEYLIKKGKKTEATQLLVEMAKADPHHIGTLKEYYEKQQMGKQPFVEYWREILNANRKEAFSFKLTLLDGTPFDLAQHKGKWILIDFWGTWCAPCVQELPTMQKFYEKIKVQNDIVLVTIACRDTEKRVQDFMQKKAYNFPVVMSDGNVEKMYPVDGYPTKILITPQGKRLRIEFGVDWVSRVNTYRMY